MRRTKIIATIGPASRSPQVIGALLAAGMDCARLNFSHGSHEEHALSVKLLREIARELQKPLTILMDLSGPKIRTGTFPGGEATLTAGSHLILTSSPGAGAIHELPLRISVTLPSLHQEVQPGQRVLLNDGAIALSVTRIADQEVYCRVQNDGVLRDHAGVNLPGAKLSIPSLTEKDKEDLAFGLTLGVDYVALSFVRRAQDVMQLKTLLQSQGKPLPVIAKLEKPEALENLETILEEADGVMVARGDLGVELPLEEVPLAQKRIIHRANQKHRLVITATQMLESMLENPRPTRAEVSDVANAVLDGTDAVMLSGETAKGRYPVEAVAMMAQIVAATEAGALHQPFLIPPQEPAADGTLSVPQAVADGAYHAALDVGAKAIVAFTQSGQTALLISKYRPPMSIVAFTPRESIQQRMGLYWGVESRLLRPLDSTDRMVEEVEKELLKSGQLAPGDLVVIIAGAPIYKKGSTNLLKVHQVGA